jgi:hypothetical protein
MPVPVMISMLSTVPVIDVSFFTSYIGEPCRPTRGVCANANDTTPATSTAALAMDTR